MHRTAMRSCLPIMLALLGAASAVPLPGASIRVAYAQSDNILRRGEYACYGSGGGILLGLGFKVVDDSRYTDLDGKNPGTYAVGRGSVIFTGGHLDGQTGRNLANGRFVVGTLATCEPFR